MSGDPAILPSIGVPLDNRTGGRLESNEKYLSFSGTFGGFFVNLSYNEGTTELYFVLPSVTDGSRDNITATRLFFGYREDLSKRVRFEGKFSYAQIRDSFTYDHLFPGFYGIEVVETIGWEGEVNTFLKPTSSLDIVAGLYYRSVFKADDTFNLPSFGVPSLENNHNFLVDSDAIVTRALFTQVDYTPSKKLRLVAGVRLEQSLKYELRHEQFSGANPPDLMSDVYDREEIEVIPRLAAIYFCNDRNIVKFLYGKAINRPSFFQNTLNSLDPLREDLEPESIETLEFNYIATVSSHLSFNISIFRNTLDNLITRVVRFDENNEYTSWSDNAGKMVTHGIELEVSAEPIEYLRMELSGSYQNTEDKRPDFENIDVAYSPNLLGYLKASYLGVGFKVAVTGQYVGAMEAFWDETRANEDGSLGGRIGDKVYSYLLLSTNLRFDDLFKEGVFINIKVSNLLDKEIRYPTFTNNEWANRGTIGAGRTFLVSMGYKF
ncbi:MAG: TonB-dependent receptor [bacterium]|nr:TonB-dependent receptor [bacterium]